MKEEIELEEKESLAYKKLLIAQDMEQMFLLGYVIGRARLSQESLEVFRKLP